MSQYGDGRDKSKAFIHAVTNEYGLFAYRFIVSACSLIITWWAFDMKTDTKEMRKDFTASQLMNEARISKLEGVVSVIDGSVRMQSRVLETHETTIQNIWSRIIDLNSRSPQRITP